MESIDPMIIAILDVYKDDSDFKSKVTDFLLKYFDNQKSSPRFHSDKYASLNYDGNFHKKGAEIIRKKGLPNKIIIPLHYKERINLSTNYYNGIKINYERTPFNHDSCSFIWDNFNI